MELLEFLKNKRGFSLLELLIYMAILAGFLAVIANLFFIISANSAKEEARAEVWQNLRFAIQQITTDLHSSAAAITVNTPAGGDGSCNRNNIMDNGETGVDCGGGGCAACGGNTLNFTISGATTDFTVASGVLQRTQSAVTQNITTNKVTVSATNPIFTRIDNAGAKPTIQIVLTISYNDNGKPDYKFSETAQTTVSLRQ